MPNERGYWNRAGRRSGGNRPTPIVVRPPTAAEAEADAAQWLLDGIRHRSPLALIVAYLLRHEDPEVARALADAHVRYDERGAL